jgi:hypothetical protein
MLKPLMTLATLAMLAAPALAESNHDFIDSCPSNKYECEGSSSFIGQYRSKAPFGAIQRDLDDREQRRKQENNTRVN